VRDPVVTREPLVDERVVRGDEVHHAAILPQLAPDKQARLLLQGLAQVLVEVGELIYVGDDAREAPELEPLVGEAVYERLRTRIAKHPPDLALQDCRIRQRSTYSQVQQLVVRDAAPEEERQPRRETDRIQPVRCPGRQV